MISVEKRKRSGRNSNNDNTGDKKRIKSVGGEEESRKIKIKNCTNKKIERIRKGCPVKP
jgi:hypothetical protein